MAKRLFIDLLRSVFIEAKNHPFLLKIMRLPPYIRYIIGIGLILFGVIGILTPIPLGLVFFVVGISVFFGIAKTRNIIFRVVYGLRLHIIYGKIYLWWRNRKQ